jgi:hypothetical protein
MRDLKEERLQHIWRHRLLDTTEFVSVTGKRVMIHSPGRINRDAGPDFSDAIISVDGVMLAGNIEIHLRTSDWIRHGHAADRRYDRIILHAVYEHDTEVPQNVKYNVEVVELKRHIRADLLKATRLPSPAGALPCSSYLYIADPADFTGWFSTMARSRLSAKAERVRSLVKTCDHNPAQAFLVLVLRSLGFHVNSLPMELLGRSLPVTLLLRHADNLLQLEALLLGMAGQLNDTGNNAYCRKLLEEFRFLRAKYNLVPVDANLFKHSRMRPFNAPAVRLAQLACIVHEHPAFLQTPHQLSTYEQLSAVLRISSNHIPPASYLNQCLPSHLAKYPGKMASESIMINAVAPFLAYFALQTGKSVYQQTAEKLLESCAPEDNWKTRLFHGTSFNRNASASQAMIHLHDQYCSAKRCLSCAIGLALLYPAGTAATAAN